MYFILGKGIYSYPHMNPAFEQNEIATALVEPCKCKSNFGKDTDYSEYKANAPIEVGDTLYVNDRGCAKIIHYLSN
jgi:hypothetical protein